MSLARFVESLMAGGRVKVTTMSSRDGQLVDPPANDLAQAAAILTEFESHYRDELPAAPPELSQPAMLWGAMVVYRASSFLAHRDSDPQLICQSLQKPCSEAMSPAVCYSADLTLRFLPDLIRLSTAASPEDPLVAVLKTLARQWPLSSTGVANIGEVDVSLILENECLRKLYVDRIIATNDRSRLADSRVREIVRAAIGVYRELSPQMADEISRDIIEPQKES